MLISDEEWSAVSTFADDAPETRLRRGRNRVDRRAALSGIVDIITGDIAWRALPTERYQVSGNTCWRQFRQWVADGTWISIEFALVHKWLELGQNERAAALMYFADKRIEAAFRRASKG
ncbi:transposase [Burkholderia reimsis]|uniref:Transposase n=1 Tax=Burkholderia reimsis TaxID=2234132 RepID=A0A365QII5_9BURK|nr:transposase [Burkholderia reimsis]RBB33071.1 transposase [Burkholderia reimsis]